MRIAFRPLLESDISMMHRWLNEPGVVQWWEGEDVSWSAVSRNYGPSNDDGIEHWIATVDGIDAAWLQCCHALDDEDETELWFDAGAHPDAWAIDYLVADPFRRGRGLGSSVIRAFTREIVFDRYPECPQVCAGPFEENVASWRALEKAGFRFVNMLDDEDGPCRLMALDRGAARLRSRWWPF